MNFKLVFLFFGLLLLSCTKDEQKKSNEAKIISWKFGDKTATIKDTDISITLPIGTDASNLKATAIISAKASISPDPTKTKDYTKPIDFVVTAEDGTTKQTYKVTVSVAKNTEAKITSWKFGDKTATINGTDISITLPYQTDLKSLTTEVEISAKASINPDPKTIKDYTRPKEFTVTAEDGTTKQTYKVTVTVAKNTEAKITLWKFGDKTATIKGTDISFSYPFETDKNLLKNLTATVEISAGASISPAPKTIKDFTNPIDFVVTAEDGTTNQTYKVTVTVEEAILLWTGGWRDDDAYKAKIDHKTNKITIDLNSADFKTKVTLSDRVVISPDPNTIDDWVSEVSFTVSKGSTTKTYKVKVTVNKLDIIKAKDSDIESIVNTQITALGNTGNLNHIDVSSVTNMSRLFQSKASFNGDISKWDVSKVTTMFRMFYKADKFNQDIGDWDVSKVTTMSNMFRYAYKFNKDIGKWNVSKVNNMYYMFSDTKAFNQDIGNWDVSNVTGMYSMFNNATAFNQDIGGWDVSNVVNMTSMFKKAEAFNQDIGTWKVSKVTDMSSMFNGTKAFNQNIGSWNVSKVTNMSSMFDKATTFNQDIGSWDVSNVIYMTSMFKGAEAFNQNIGSWKVSKVWDMNYMFNNAKAFNQNISLWDVKRVNNCSNFSKDATAFKSSNKPKFTKCTP